MTERTIFRAPTFDGTLKAVDNYFALNEALTKQVKNHIGSPREEYSQEWRRTYVKEVLVCAEGRAALFRDLIAQATTELGITLEGITMAVLTKDRGEPAFAKLKTAYEAMRGFVGGGEELPPDFWEAVQRGVRLRNRLTHPRSAGDLDVSDADFKDAAAVLLYDVALGTLVKPVYDKLTALAKASRTFTRPNTKQGANELCACGSGLKFKKCHGASAETL
jgi:hypothetical protein